MENKISYLNRTFEDYKEALIYYSKKYYPDLSTDFDDASVGSWLIDLNAEIGDNLSYHIDRVFQETNINSAQEKSSVYAMARNAGMKIPGPKGAMAEVRFSCFLPLAEGNGTTGTREPDWGYAPIIKRGTRVSSSNQSFELLEDINFAEQFDNNGNSDRTISPITNSNGLILKYLVTKLAVVTAGESKIYKKEIYSNDVRPFFEVLIPSQSVMNIESIILKDGNALQTLPTYNEFYMPNETSDTFKSTTRFFEVDSLAQQERWGEKCEGEDPVIYEYSYLDEYNNAIPTYSVTRGEWKPLKHKFMTEYTDKGYMKVIFGAGIDPKTDINIEGGSDFARYQISKTIKNDSLGLLPEAGKTLYILYRVGGGSASNLAKGAINKISTLKVDIPCIATNNNANKRNAVTRSVTVTSTTPSVSGKDMPNTSEMKYLIKYNSGEQERCVTVKDYISRILKMPSKYGTPFRVGVGEENNKIMVYLLGLDHNGYLDATLPDAIVKNISDYLSNYRMINDYVEIKSGRIINLSFEADVYVDKNYNKTDVVNSIINIIEDYMDVNKHNMGDDIFVGDIEKEISKTDGVLNLIDFRVYNEIGEGYSDTQIAQEIVSYDECTESEKEDYTNNTRLRIDLDASDSVIYSDGDAMLEIRYPNRDIKVRVKTR